MTVRMATADMRETLEALWLAAFPNDRAYLSLFFDRCYAPERAAVVLGDTGVESVLHYLPITFRSTGSLSPFAMLYAGGTFPAYRRKGNYERLLTFYQRYCEEMGLAGYLLHASPPAARICDRMGIPAPLRLHQTRFHRTRGASEVPWSPCSYPRFADLRARYVDAADNTFCWQADMLPFIYDDIRYSGRLLAAEIDGASCYAVVEDRAEGLFVRELGCPPPLVPRAMESLLAAQANDTPAILQTRAPLRPDSTAVYAGHVSVTGQGADLMHALSDRAYFNLYAN